MAPVLFLSCFLKHLLRMEAHLLSFRSTVLDSTASVFITYPGIGVTSRLFWVELRWTSRRFHISSTAAIDYSHFVCRKTCVLCCLGDASLHLDFAISGVGVGPPTAFRRNGPSVPWVSLPGPTGTKAPTLVVVSCKWSLS